MSNMLAARLANQPVLVERGMADWMVDNLRIASEQLQETEAKMHTDAPMMYDGDDDFWPADDSWLSYFRPYKVVDGTLMVPIKGMLLNEFTFAFGSWATGYTYIRKAFERGMADPNVKRIAMIINSGGGEVAGNFDLVDKIYAMRGDKPIQAFVNEHAYSAAFSLASAADKINVTRTGGVGSVGVVTAHYDQSKWNEKVGFKVTFIFAGDHKVDGNPHEPLPADVKNRMQARINGLYDIFVSTVGRNLGIGEDVVRGTQALTYSAEEAVEIGFAHAIRPFDDAMADFNGLSANPGDIVMSDTKQQETAQVDQAALDTARAEGRNEGTKAERERIQGILGCDEAKSRRDLAFHLAMNTDQSVESAKGILAASPEVAEKPESAKAPGADFEAAMKQDDPAIEAEGEQQEASLADQLIKDYRAFTGMGDK